MGCAQIPSPRYSGERGRGEGLNSCDDKRRSLSVMARTQPLSPTLSPEYRGEGVNR